MKFKYSFEHGAELIDEPSIFKDAARNCPLPSLEELMRRKAVLLDLIEKDTVIDESILNDESSRIADRIMADVQIERKENLYGDNSSYGTLFATAFEEGYGTIDDTNKKTIGRWFSSFYRFGFDGGPDGANNNLGNLHKLHYYQHCHQASKKTWKG